MQTCTNTYTHTHIKKYEYLVDEPYKEGQDDAEQHSGSDHNGPHDQILICFFTRRLVAVYWQCTVFKSETQAVKIEFVFLYFLCTLLVLGECFFCTLLYNSLIQSRSGEVKNILFKTTEKCRILLIFIYNLN